MLRAINQQFLNLENDMRQQIGAIQQQISGMQQQIGATNLMMANIRSCTCNHTNYDSNAVGGVVLQPQTMQSQPRNDNNSNNNNNLSINRHGVCEKLEYQGFSVCVFFFGKFALCFLAIRNCGKKNDTCFERCLFIYLHLFF